MKNKSLLLFLVFLVGGYYSTISSQCVTTPNFDGSAVTESFEGLSAGPNISQSGGYFEPGINSPFTFASGLIYSNPVPNAGLGDEYVVIDGGVWGFTSNGSASGNIPFGTAFFGHDDPESGSPPAEFTFPYIVDKVGFYFTCGDNTSDELTLRAYDSSNSLIATCTGGCVISSQWANNFIGIETPGIARIEISGNFFGVDGLTFQQQSQTAAIPTMSEWGFFLFGLIIFTVGVVALYNVKKRAVV